MYTIQNDDNIYVIGRLNPYQRNIIYSKKIGNENDLIKFLAHYFNNNALFDEYTWNQIPNCAFDFYYFDYYGRIYNPNYYRKDAYLYWENFLKDKDKNYKKYYAKNKIYYGTFRKTPIAGTGKKRGGPSEKPKKIKHIAMMYSNPDYREFNRGSRKDYPEGYWDDFHRQVERNWKKQRQYQWKE